MKRGFPRPVTKVENIQTSSLKHMNEIYGNRPYPHPYTARIDKISRMHFGRVRECIIFRKCSVCGNPVKPDELGEVTVILDRGDFSADSGPFHEKCAVLAKIKCPLIATQGSRFTIAKRKWANAQPSMRKAYSYNYGHEIDPPGT
jgi:hypothetical protein